MAASGGHWVKAAGGTSFVRAGKASFTPVAGLRRSGAVSKVAARMAGEEYAQPVYRSIARDIEVRMAAQRQGVQNAGLSTADAERYLRGVWSTEAAGQRRFRDELRAQLGAWRRGARVTAGPSARSVAQVLSGLKTARDNLRRLKQAGG